MRERSTLILLFLVLQALDVLTTRTALALGMSEGNPLAAEMLRTGGEPLVYVLKAVITLAVVATVLVYSARYPRVVTALKVGVGYMVLVVTINLLNLVAVA